ncbi:hypothetical protein AC480_05105 [miscellaneous Crenarchaeota group archaeon SMTZ1-55]|nr:MAG: hypothetical protein AC480_05105 [miscellaneous Crenarchaeota group archaeon SMTZ1-55]
MRLPPHGPPVRQPPAPPLPVDPRQRRPHPPCLATRRPQIPWRSGSQPRGGEAPVAPQGTHQRQIGCPIPCMFRKRKHINTQVGVQ